MEYKILNNGVEMPMLGLGVYQMPPEDTERCVAQALAAGYRLSDTAQAYGNEEGVAAIAKSGVPRDEVFVTSKIWVSNMNYARAASSIGESLRAPSSSAARRSTSAYRLTALGALRAEDTDAVGAPSLSLTFINGWASAKWTLTHRPRTARHAAFRRAEHLLDGRARHGARGDPLLPGAQHRGGSLLVHRERPAFGQNHRQHPL